MARDTGLKPQTVSTRCSELKRAGLIAAAGFRRRTDNATAEVLRAVNP